MTQTNSLAPAPPHALAAAAMVQQRAQPWYKQADRAYPILHHPLVLSLPAPAQAGVEGPEAQRRARARDVEPGTS